MPGGKHTVKFCLFLPGRGLPAVPSLLSARALGQIAALAEGAGFEGFALDEHPAAPESWRTMGDGHDAVDPFVGLAAVAAATRSAQLITGLAVAPFRNPFLTAKAAATLDVLSEGRCVLGLGGGYLEDEFAALGVDFAERNELFDEALEVIRLAWSGEPVDYAGRHFTARGIRSLPTPHAGREIPIWIGGNSRRALRRAAVNGCGWISMPHKRGAAVSRRSAPLESLADLRTLIARLQEFAAEAGRHGEHRDIVHPLGVLGTADSARKEIEILAEAGVTWVSVVNVPNNYDDAARMIDRFGTEIIAPSP
jgi:probable F420-dependent oxidoreductase